jgi:aldehyde:ferredoxin oxidoreductase
MAESAFDPRLPLHFLVGCLLDVYVGQKLSIFVTSPIVGLTGQGRAGLGCAALGLADLSFY